MTHKGTVTLEAESLVLREVDESNMSDVGVLKCSTEQSQFTNRSEDSSEPVFA